jgi:predicted nucleotide-binding protein (sugar kinase/HSP70/actin superfamily)
MPSTQSDGVQSKVAEDIGSLFVSVETSGDAEANVKSRILMKLYEAKIKAREEFEQTKLKLNITDEKINLLLAKKGEIKRADTVLPEVSSVTAVNALHYLVD